MPRIYFYKLTTDDGGAPCVQNDLLSLAICKPMIRTAAAVGDLIFGFAANSLHADNRLLYIACVTAKACDGSYYTTAKFSHRHDCIYERRESRFVWRKGALYHGPEHLVHDLGSHPYPRADVLLSTDFRYFGANGTADYKVLYPVIKEAVEGLGRGHRVRHDEPLRVELLALRQKVWRKKSIAGRPSSAAQCGVSHRGRSCGVIGECGSK